MGCELESPDEAAEPAEVPPLVCADTPGVAETDDGFIGVAATVSPGEALAAAADLGEAVNPGLPRTGTEGEGAIEGEGDMEQQL